MSDLHKIASKYLKDKDLLELSEEAKEKSMLLLDEQGISAMALALSKTFADIIQHPKKVKT